MTVAADQPAHRTPRQARSRATLERIYGATERLLESHPFQQITVQQIVRAAHTSVGSFYARFADKHALLPALYARYDSHFSVRFGALRRRTDSKDRTLEQTVRSIARLMVDWFSSQRHLLRALALYVRMHPEKIDQENRERRRNQLQFLSDALNSHRDEIRHHNPDRAIEMGLFFAVSACRERVLFGGTAHSAMTGVSNKLLIREVTHMLLGYLER